MSDFFQTPPVLTNQYLEDPILRGYLKRILPHKMFSEVEPDLINLGERAVTDILALGEIAESFPPKHVPYDPWGRRVDRIEVSDAWKKLDSISASEKLIAIGYERKHKEFSRLYQFAKLYLFHPSSAIYTCPLAMTDGAARAIELYGDASLKSHAFKRLTSSNPEKFWTSGQWMTERTGGSDVSGTSTIARFENGKYKLYGTKWFTSATTAQMAMTLARIEGAPEGSKGLSLFYLELRDSNGNLNGIQVNRLKDKLGTRALPTAELELNGTVAQLVGGVGDGVKKISSLFNITRIYNAVCATGYMRRGIALAKSYADQRVAFGKKLSENSLHMETIADLEVEFEAAFLLTFRTIELLGRDECEISKPEETSLLRLLTPLAKLMTAKQAIAVSSEVLECFGGAGYVEDTGLPRLLRDSQVLSIWEGTTNVLSMDVQRAIQKENAAGPFFADIESRLEKIHSKEIASSITQVHEACKLLKNYKGNARKFAVKMAQNYAASLMLEHAAASGECKNAITWCERL